MTSKPWLLSVLLASLLTAHLAGCYRDAKPAVVTVREPCIKTEPPGEQILMDCLTRGHKAEDCLAVENNMLRAWIRTQIAKCGAK